MFKPLNISPSLEQVIQSLKTMETVYTPLQEAKKELGKRSGFDTLSKSLDDLESSMATYQESLMEYIEDITGNSNLTVCNFDDLKAALDEEVEARKDIESTLNDKVREQLEKNAAELSALRAEMEKDADKHRKALSEVKELREKVQSEAMERSKSNSGLREYAREQGGRGVPTAVIALILGAGALALALSGWTLNDLISFVQSLFA